MQVFMLVEPKHCPVPDNVKIVESYSDERVVFFEDDVSDEYKGEVCLLEANESALASWLRAFDAIVITNNPMVGDWRRVHVKE